MTRINITNILSTKSITCLVSIGDMMADMIVEALSVSRATDGVSGEELMSVQFGKVSRVGNATPKSNAPFAMVGQTVSLVLTLFFKFKEVAPYKVGSKWSLAVSEDGAIQLKEEKK